MRPLQIDFVARRSASLAGWLLLLSGAAAACFALVSYQEVDQRIAARDTTLQEIERTLPRAGGRPQTAQESRVQQATLAAARRIEDKLSLPWSALFSMLESQANHDVALLSLAPDPSKQQLRLTAEARTLGAMLEFHRRLEGSGELADVALISHEIVENVPGRPVRFDLTARWSIDRAYQ